VSGRRLDIVDVEAIVGTRSFGDEPTLIIPAETAQRALEQGCLEELVKQGIAALVLSGQKIVYVKGHK
jgi:hypothetical protein